MTKKDLRDLTFQLVGTMPPVACANCRDKKNLAIVPYHAERGGPMLAVLLLCGLCRHALANHELGASIEIRVAGEKPF